MKEQVLELSSKTGGEKGILTELMGVKEIRDAAQSLFFFFNI